MADKSEKTDRRVSRTRAALRQALEELTREKGYDSVTIEELTARADVGRTTFYLHYRDKEDLLLEQFTELLDEQLVPQFAELSLADWRLTPVDSQPQAQPFRPVLVIFQHVQENADLYRLVWRAENVNKITKRLRNILEHAIDRIVRLRRQVTPDLMPSVPLDLIASYVAGGLLAAVGWWLESGGKTSPEEMTTIFQRIFIPGFRQMMADGNS